MVYLIEIDFMKTTSCVERLLYENVMNLWFVSAEKYLIFVVFIETQL